MKKERIYQIAEIRFTKSGKSYVVREAFGSYKEAKKKLKEINDISYIIIKEERTYYL